MSSSPMPTPAAVLISASRRTDVPRYYARWFAERRRAGFAEYRTSFGVVGRASLRDEDVLGFVFWTRDARPFERELRELRARGLPYAFQFTLTPYGRELERRRPSGAGALESLLRVRELLPGPSAIEWRYDPIVLCDRYDLDFHLAAFERLSRRLAGVTRVVNVSLVEPYRKAVRRVADPSVRWRDPEERARTRREPGLIALDLDTTRRLGRALAALASAAGMEARSCCNPALGLPPSQCVGVDLFRDYGPTVTARVTALRAAPSRPSCRCLRAVDIGMDETCPAGCRYCYVVSSDERPLLAIRRHDPSVARLR